MKRHFGQRTAGQWGFTLGELLLVVSLGTFAATGVKSFLSHTRGANDERRREEDLYRELTTQGRGAVDRMVQEVGQAGTPAPLPASPPGDDTSFDEAAMGASETAANSNRVAARQFLVATPTQIIFEADLDRDGAVERVEYRLNGEALERSAVSKNPDGTAPEAEYETVVQNVDNGAMPLFSYPNDPFAAALSGQNPSVRILLLLRAPEGKSKKQPYRTVGFEGVASLQIPAGNVQTAVQAAPQQQTLLQSDESAEPGLASNASPDWPPVRAIYSNKWTMK